MKTSELARVLNARCVQNQYTDADLAGAYTGDLLSDVMAHAIAEGVLITIQAHKNTVAVATLKDLRAIVLCNNRPVPEDMIEAAQGEGIALFVTPLNQFEISGLLYPRICQ